MNKDDKDKYLKQLEDKIALLEARIKELERMLGINSQNSSKPPSSDGPEVLQPRTRGEIRRKRGARKGHQPYLRKLFPPEEVTKFIPHEPPACTCGGEDLEECDEEPLRHQTVDIPPVKPIVIEHVQYVRRCKKCGALVYAPLPDEVRRNIFGPGVLAIVGVLTGMLNTSKRKALAVITEVFQVPMSLGGLSNCEAQLTKVLEQPYNEAVEHVREQEIGHADETGWPRGNRKKGWLWTLGGTTAVFFMVQARRSQKAARQLIGGFAGKLVSDRYNAYNFYPFLRQICWAHLKRDFKAIGEAGGKLGKIGLELHQLSRQILKMRARVRDGTLLWQTFQRRMPELQKQVELRLEAGACFNGKLGGKCRDILKQKKYLWGFVEDQDMEPTNNFAERIVRQGVLWRKTSFGTQSERGARYVERILTACATCRLQGQSVIAYLRNACHCHLDGIPVPSLIKTSGC